MKNKGISEKALIEKEEKNDYKLFMNTINKSFYYSPDWNLLLQLKDKTDRKFVKMFKNIQLPSFHVLGIGYIEDDDEDVKQMLSNSIPKNLKMFLFNDNEYKEFKWVFSYLL